MTGYQEVLTDPSYAGQIVTMTSRRSATTACRPRTSSRARPQVAGFIVRESSPVASNWRADCTLRDYLVAQRHRRHRGHRHARADAQAAVGRRHARRSSRPARVDPAALVERAQAIPQMEGADLVQEVTCEAAYDWPADEDAGRVRRRRPSGARRRRLTIAAYDFGIKTEHPAPARRAQLRRPRVPGDGAGGGAAGDRSPTACS